MKISKYERAVLDCYKNKKSVSKYCLVLDLDDCSYGLCTYNGQAQTKLLHSGTSVHINLWKTCIENIRNGIGKECSCKIQQEIERQFLMKSNKLCKYRTLDSKLFYFSESVISYSESEKDVQIVKEELQELLGEIQNPISDTEIQELDIVVIGYAPEVYFISYYVRESFLIDSLFAEAKFTKHYINIIKTGEDQPEEGAAVKDSKILKKDVNFDNAKRLFVGNNLISYYDADTKKIYIIHGNGQVEIKQDAIEFSASERNYAVLYRDGSVEVFGNDNIFGQKNTKSWKWKGVQHILAGPNCTYGITRARQIVYAGSLADSSILKWTKLKALKSCGNFIVGVHLDGTISVANNSAAGFNLERVNIWSKMKDIAISQDCILGLTSDGKVRFSGKKDDPRSCVEEWKDIVILAADHTYVYGVSKKGKVFVAGECKKFLDKGRKKAFEWEHIIALSSNQAGVGAITETGELKFAGTIIGDLQKINDSWNQYVKPVIYRDCCI